MLENIGFIIFCMVFMTVFVIARTIAYSNTKIEKTRKNFFAQENKANSVRRKDISALDYVALDLSRLPIDKISLEELLPYANTLKELADKKILNLSAYTNTELKLMYGPANLEELSEYDSNFTELIRSLDKLGNGMLEAGNTDDARIFFEYAVGIGSDITTTFTGLATVYITLGKQNKIDELISLAEKIKSLSGPIIVNKLNIIKNSV